MIEGLCIGCNAPIDLEKVEEDKEYCELCLQKEKHNLAVGKYRTENSNGVNYVRQQNSSKPHRESQKRYANSEKGKLAAKRAEQKRSELLSKVKLVEERESQGLCVFCGSRGHGKDFHGS